MAAFVEQTLAEQIKGRKARGKADLERGLKQLTEAVQQLELCSIEEVEQTVLQASLALKTLTGGIVDTAMSRLYDRQATRCDTQDELDELRYRQPALERTWKESLRRRVLQ